MSPRPEGPERYRLSKTRINEIDRATPDWETLEAEVDFGPRAHVRVLLEHIAYLEGQQGRMMAMYRAYQSGLATGGMECIRSYDALAGLPEDTNIWGSALDLSGWGAPYSKNHDGQWYDIGNGYFVPGEDIVLPAYVLPPHPYSVLSGRGEGGTG